MMRPVRAFIMPRSTALDSLNTDARLVCITASQSSVFMRSSKHVARDAGVVAQDADGPLARLDVARCSASIDSWLVDVQHRAAAAARASASPMRSRPPRVVAVPTTRAPSRGKARGDRRTDAARGAGDQCHLPDQSCAAPRASPATAASASSSDCGSSSASICRSRLLVDAAVQAGQHLARAAFDRAGWRRPRSSCAPSPPSRPGYAAA